MTGQRLSRYAGIDYSNVQLSGNPTAFTSIHDSGGPIAVIASWEIKPERRHEFVAAMELVRRPLKRAGGCSSTAPDWFGHDLRRTRF